MSAHSGVPGWPWFAINFWPLHYGLQRTSLLSKGWVRVPTCILFHFFPPFIPALSLILFVSWAPGRSTSYFQLPTIGGTISKSYLLVAKGYVYSYNTGCEPLKCIIQLSFGIWKSLFLPLFVINKTSEMSYESIRHRHSYLLFAGHFTAVAGNVLPPPSFVWLQFHLFFFFFFFIKTLQWCLTFDLTANCYISKVWVQDVDMITWEHTAVTNMIRNWRLSIQSRSSISRHFMGKVSLRKTQPQISEAKV